MCACLMLQIASLGFGSLESLCLFMAWNAFFRECSEVFVSKGCRIPPLEGLAQVGGKVRRGRGREEGEVVGRHVLRNFPGGRTEVAR